MRIISNFLTLAGNVGPPMVIFRAEDSIQCDSPIIAEDESGLFVTGIAPIQESWLQYRDSTTVCMSVHKVENSRGLSKTNAPDGD